MLLINRYDETNSFDDKKDKIGKSSGKRKIVYRKRISEDKHFPKRSEI